ncbi:Alpha/Beta hydrolase protein [Bombardia bombarda]|uniref:Alpha/Beta hydrolase protein n=1 Tax=Bombardia bombarda TaxID=252184 RepID=A0AA40BVI9_9PEZI|nr:Alpha/Beta hydrolase protein [Bombardia bombarda]
MASLESTVLAGHTISRSLSNPKISKPVLPPSHVGKDLIEDHILPQLDPEFVKYFVDVVSKAPASHEIPIEEVRANWEQHRPPCALDTSSGFERVADYVVSSQDGAEILVRVYHPDPMEHGRGPYPVHLNFHGGGFVLGDLTVEASLCLSMREAGVVVIDVNYRHCPETIWGKCIQDAWAALNWARDSSSILNINPTSVSVGGISAGGQISIILQHMARDAGIPLKLCMASVPCTTEGLSYRYYTQSPYPSFHEFHRGPVLPWKRINYFGSYAMPPEKLPELRALWPAWWLAPLTAPNFRGLCDTFIRTAECDPLRDEGEAYGMKLVAGGNKVTIKRYLGSVHTFMYLGFMKQKQEYDRDAVEALRVAHGLS